MRNNRVFLDTNILIYLLQGDEEIRGLLEDKIWYISFITEMELLLKPNITDIETKAIKALIQECFIIDMNHAIKELAITTGQKHKLKIADSIIYASASSIMMPFLTADKIFKRLTADDTSILVYEV
jgi:predicted nucleic acid-binding protein